MYNGKDVFILIDNENNLWFKAKDIIEILGYVQYK